MEQEPALAATLVPAGAEALAVAVAAVVVVAAAAVLAVAVAVVEVVHAVRRRLTARMGHGQVALTTAYAIAHVATSEFQRMATKHWIPAA